MSARSAIILVSQQQVPLDQDPWRPLYFSALNGETTRVGGELLFSRHWGKGCPMATRSIHKLERHAAAPYSLSSAEEKPGQAKPW